MALCETQLSCKAWESRGMPPRKFVQSKCSEIIFCANFDLLADKLNNTLLTWCNVYVFNEANPTIILFFTIVTGFAKRDLIHAVINI